MEKDEVLTEAINQFKSQGVDLSNIDLTEVLVGKRWKTQ